MKSLVLAAAITLSGLVSHALEVNDQAPCVVLNQIKTDNSEAEHCIRDRTAQQKFTMVEFFSITCSDCAANLPHLTALAKSVESNATTRLVSVDRKEITA